MIYFLDINPDTCFQNANLQRLVQYDNVWQRHEGLRKCFLPGFILPQNKQDQKQDNHFSPHSLSMIILRSKEAVETISTYVYV